MEHRPTNPRRVTLVFDTANAFHRDIVAGIGEYVRQHAPEWQLGIATDVAHALSTLSSTGGIIADIDLAPVQQLHPQLGKTPIVYVSSAESARTPPGVPLVAVDNTALVESALEHLRSCGLDRFAYYCQPQDGERSWAVAQREAFVTLTRETGESLGVHTPSSTDAAQNVAAGPEKLAQWLRNLPTHTGILAANDDSARELLHVCNTLRRQIPDDLALVSLGRDPLSAALSPVSISSISHDSQEIGLKAADLLHRKISGRPIKSHPHFVNRAKVDAAATSPGHKSLPVLRKAQQFITANAARGIKAAQVADHCGVSRSTLERMFACLIGRTVHDEILATRLLMAKKLLSEQVLGTAEIARRCGFRTHQYMHVVFRRELGCTPTDFAAAAQKRRNTVAE